MHYRQMLEEVEMMLRQYNELSGDILVRNSLCLSGPGIHEDFMSMRSVHTWLSGAVSALQRADYKQGVHDGD